MKKPTYYDIITKQEISEKELRFHIPYIIMKEKWKIRIITFEPDGRAKENLLTLQEEQIARREILRQKLIQMGYQVENINSKDNFMVDDIQINIPNYEVQLKDKQGREKQESYDMDSLESFITTTQRGREINIISKTISNSKALIELPTMSSKMSNITLNIDQWGFGFKGTYNLRKLEDRERLMKDLKGLPRSKEEAMKMKSKDEQKEKFIE